ncbi:MAG: EAL domain-containing protein [Clostridium sp.]|nr:EAL domain-containing protein [Clostridium sp.]
MHYTGSNKRSALVKIKPIISIAVFIIMFIAVVVTNTIHIEYFVFGNIEIRPSSLSGVFNSIQNLTLVYLVMKLRKKGYIIAISLLVLNAFATIIPLLYGNYSSVAGIANILVAFAMLSVLNKCLNMIKTNEEILYRIAVTDSLTGLPNRRSLNEHLKKKVNEENKFGLVFIDLDDFKNVNDTVGHEYGDKVICEVAHRWNSILGKNDFLARIGGDAFALVINDYENKDDLVHHVGSYIDALYDKFHSGDEDFFISASMGISCYPEHSKDYEALLRYADTAMYYAKRKGNKHIVIFENKQMDIVKKDVEMEKKIRNAIKNEDFYLNFQPQFEIRTHKLRGFEALIRMKGEDGKVLSPGLFIPQAEKTDVIIEIDRLVLKNALKEFRKLIEFNDKLIVSVNVSVKHIQEKNFIQDVKNALKENDFPARNLEIEITEYLFITSLNRSAKILADLKELGIHIALDDFGTGYASLSYLNKLPIDTIKVDKSFIDQLHENGENNDFVEAIVSMGHTLKFKVISEGVEREDQLNILRNFNCDYVQGFVWGKPMDYIDAEKLVNEDKMIRTQ